MNTNFEVTNMPDDVYFNVDSNTVENTAPPTPPTTPTNVVADTSASCGKRPFFAGKRRDAYDTCTTTAQKAEVAKQQAKDAELASAKALAESASAQVQAIQADADMKKADSVKALAEAQALKDAADATAKKKADLADDLKGAAAVSKLASEKFEADKAAIAAGKSSGTNWFMWGVVAVAVIIGARMLMKSPKSVTA